MSKLIKNPDLLVENHRSSDYFFVGEYAKNLCKILQESTHASVTVIEGEYGSGKSVLINEVKKLTEDRRIKKPKWIIFECWKYADKSDLWEAFILEVADKIGAKVYKKISGKYSSEEKWYEKFLGFIVQTIPQISIILVAITYVLFTHFGHGVWLDKHMALVVAGVVIVLSTIYFIKPRHSSVARQNDYVADLKSSLAKFEENLYIVLEDVDRAGDLGRQFFETVASFIKEGKVSNKNIKLLVPIAGLEDANAGESSTKVSLRESVMKAADDLISFKPNYESTRFVEAVFRKEFIDGPTKNFLVCLINGNIGGKMSVRQVKLALRNSVRKYERLRNTYKDVEDISLVICIALEFEHKYIRSGNLNLLYEWGQAKGFVKPDEGEIQGEKWIEPRRGFETSEDIFGGIKKVDKENVGLGRNGKPQWVRSFYISKIYHGDL